MSENSISSGELYKYPELIEKNVNDYSFTQELVNATNNYEFKKNAYQTLSGTIDNEYSYIWTALSAIVGNNTKYDRNKLSNDTGLVYTENSPALLHDDIAKAFESNIINYIDNIADVDVCNVKALQSMIQQLGITYTILDKISLMPRQLQNLIDVLSIKREYLVNASKMNPLFAQLLYAEVSSLVSVDTALSDIVSSLTSARLSSEISTSNEAYLLSSMLDKPSVDISSYIDDQKLYNFTYSVYSNVLSDFCNLTYNNSMLKIYADLSTSIMLSDFALYNTNEDEVNAINNYRLKYNIPKDFDITEEFDNIENGISAYEDYTIHEQYLLSAEYDYRRQPLSASALYSRYYYYRQRTVRDFFKFIESEYADYLSIYLNTEKYEIDNSYLVVNNDNKTSLMTSSGSLVSCMLNYTAKTLADITVSVRDIREQLKTQVQRNFLKGTKQHIEYLIREYVRNNVYSTYKKLATDLSFSSNDIHEYEVSDVVINVNEYSDPTEYFNLSTAVDALSDNVNPRFWTQNMSTHALAPFNCNNLFQKPVAVDAAMQQSFTQADIQNLYRQVLQTSFQSRLSNSYALSAAEQEQNMLLSDFLDAVYDTGADTTYADASRNICCNLDFKSNQENESGPSADQPLPPYYVSSTQAQQNQKNSELLEYSEALDNLCAICDSNKSSLSLDSLIKTYSNSISNLSTMTVGNYSEFMTEAAEILEATDETQHSLSANEVSATTSENDIEWRKYKEDLFKKYTGLSLGSASFYNIKNQRHASYQIHPYVKNFVESSKLNFPIDSIANLMTEKVMSLLVNDMSSYVDDDGYIINEWNNMLNTNSDYITEYENSANKSPAGVVSKQIDYDGLFYPEAVYEYIEDSTAFTLSLYNSASPNVCTNRWYKDLNLSEFERKHISDQLSRLSNLISAVATSPYDIYRYGKDFYGNAYSLVKKYSNVEKLNDNLSVSDEEKLSTSGIIWMRLKNHPISFPMMYKYNNTPSNIEQNLNIDEFKYAQIKYVSDRQHGLQSNSKFNDLCCMSVDNALCAICINDFTISKDKTELLFLGNVTENENAQQYVVHANIKKQYLRNPPFQMYCYYMTLDSNSTANSIDSSSGFSLNKNNSKYKFNCFYNFGNYPGVLAEYADISVDNSISTLVCHVYMPYWNKHAIDTEQLNGRLLANLSCENCAADATEDYKIDITSTKRISIAYRNDLLSEHIKVKDYLGKEFEYPPKDSELNDSLNIISNGISTKDWKFDAKHFVYSEYRQYISYNDMGFVPMYKFTEKNNTENNNYVNKIYNTTNDILTNKWYTDCLSGKGQLKINLIGSAKSDNGIFFKHIVPARMHEQYAKDNKDDVLANKLLQKANYFNARYSEMPEDSYLSSAMTAIYDPHEFQRTIGTDALSLRIDESYTRIFEELNNSNVYGNVKVSKTYLDMFHDIPYLYVCTNNNIYENCIELYNPGASGQNIKVPEDQYVIQLSSNNDVNDTISVSWISANNNIYGNKQGIKLDFNTAYYNDNKDPQKKNYFNWKHQFLNLDKPGDCGYLQIWHNNGNAQLMKPGNIYFIKNISDDKPKFIISLSGEFNQRLETDQVELLANHEYAHAADKQDYSSYNNAKLEITIGSGNDEYSYNLTIDTKSTK